VKSKNMAYNALNYKLLRLFHGTFEKETRFAIKNATAFFIGERRKGKVESKVIDFGEDDIKLQYPCTPMGGIQLEESNWWTEKWKNQ
jgi:hypothetical protein